jgi:hypothetical protein
MYSLSFWHMQGRHITPNCKAPENFLSQVLKKQIGIFVLSEVGNEHVFKLHASSLSTNVFACLYYSSNIHNYIHIRVTFSTKTKGRSVGTFQQS